MIPRDLKRCLALYSRLSIPFWTGSVAQWCADNLRFNEPKLTGPFNFSGREYMREPLDAWSDDSIKDMELCWGTRTGKTRIIFGGVAWRVKCNPTRALWVMPSATGTGGASNVSRTRLQPMFRASPCLAGLIPTGSARHDWKTAQMIVNGSIIDITGSNSPGAVAGNPCDVVIQDETDKFKRRGESEAHPSDLADERCKEFSTPKRVKTSTPTLFSGLIWQKLLQSDIRRRSVPCPHCGRDHPASRRMVFIWNEQFTTLPITISEAVKVARVTWDKEAAGPGGEWDLDRVIRSARVECPHCGGHIRDEHKMWMDKNGEWIPTRTGVPGFAGWHLPSMYSVSSETNFGQMAKRFLSSQKSITPAAMQGFINSDLAEPYMSQDIARERIELITPTRIERGAEWKMMLTGDYQQKSPRLWYVVRAWDGGSSEGVEAGHCEQFQDLRAIQTKWKVQNEGVIIDSGFGAKLQTDSAVYRECAAYCEPLGRTDQQPILMGWMPAKGFPGYKRWKNDGVSDQPFHMSEVDPYLGTTGAGQVVISLFEFCSDFFKDVLENMRVGKRKEKWSISAGMILGGIVIEDYWHHMDSNVIDRREDKRTHYEHHAWAKRSRHWPDHLYDCEVMQVAGAMQLEFFKLE